MDNEWKDQFDYYYNKVNNANVESAQKQMDFQREMSNTSHVREVKDLIAAGLNPVLSANNGASSPMGAYANVDSSPISAKFASKNLDKELENARKITAMQNNNAMAIALRQIGANMQMQKYATDENNRTSRFNTIVNEYGPLAGLVYGMTEGMYGNLPGVNGAISSMSDTGDMINGLLDTINNSAGQSKTTQDIAQAFIDFSNKVMNGEDTSGKTYFYGDNVVYESKSSPTFGMSYNPNSKFANSAEKMKQRFIDYIKRTSPSDGKKPKQYNNYKRNKHGNGHARTF